MAFEHRENSGSLFVNKKRDSEKHPNAVGSALIGGVRYRVSAWTKLDKNGQKWQSLAFQRDEHSSAPAPAPEANDNPVAEIESDVPF